MIANIRRSAPMRYNIGDRVCQTGYRGKERNYGTVIAAGFRDHMVRAYPQYFNYSDPNPNQIVYVVRWDVGEISGANDYDPRLWSESEGLSISVE